MRARCFGRSKLAGHPSLHAACVCAFILLGGTVAGGTSRARAESPPAQQNSAQSTAPAADQADVLDPSIGDQPGRYVPADDPNDTTVVHALQNQPASPQAATPQVLATSGNAQTSAPSAQPVPTIQVVDIPAVHSDDQRRQQINEQCSNLLKMANALKAQVDKTTKDQLSVAVIRQANQIEQLAHKVRDEMRPAVASKN